MKPSPSILARGGFSLVELLIVVSVLAILVGLLLPAIGVAKDAARSAKCLNNLRNLSLANQLYANGNRGLSVPAFLSSSNGNGNWGASWAYWMNNGEFLEGIEIPANGGNLTAQTRCTRSYGGTLQTARNYGLNLSAPGYRFPNWWDYAPGRLVSPRLAQVPSGTALFVDGLDWLVIGEWQSQDWTMASEVNAGWGEKVSYRHRNRSQAALADGAARAFTKADARTSTPEGLRLWRGESL